MVREAWKATYSPCDCKESDTAEQLTLSLWASLVAQRVKSLACNAGDLGSIPWVRKSPWRREWQPTPVFLPGESHGQSSLVGLGSTSPWGHKELDLTEPLTHTYHHCYSVGRMKKGLEGRKGSTEGKTS